MSPFDLIPPKRASCWSEGSDHLEAHARGCACPCGPCEQLQFAFANWVGSLSAESAIAFSFVYALGHLRVTQFSADASPMFGLYKRLCKEKDVKEPEPRVTMGWLVTHDDVLRVVRAPSDPWKGVATQALQQWATAEGRSLTFGNAAADGEQP